MMGEYDAGYEHYIDSLIREIEKLQDENDKLREQVSSLVGRSFRTADKMSCIEAENAKLRELLRIVVNKYCESGTCDGCPILGKDDSCPY
jgi:predicted nuclease with TOPRIM domain